MCPDPFFWLLMLKVVYYETFYKMKYYIKHIKHLNLYEKPMQKLLIPSTYPLIRAKKARV